MAIYLHGEVDTVKMQISGIPREGIPRKNVFGEEIEPREIPRNRERIINDLIARFKDRFVIEVIEDEEESFRIRVSIDISNSSNLTPGYIVSVVGLALHNISSEPVIPSGNYGGI